jgi:hypothetical protein
MSKTLPIFLTVLFLVSGAYTVLAQGTECDQALSHAEDEFSAGHFYAIPTILGECPEHGLSQEQTVRAYLILCQAYLILDNPIAADDSYLRLLKADPEYVASEDKDPIDIVYLSKKFTARPVFTPHFRIGLNTSMFRSIYQMTTEPYDISSSGSPSLGFQLGGGIDWNISDNISLCGEVNFATRSYKREASGIDGTDKQTVTGHQSWFDFPLYVKYASDKGNVRPFGYAGFAFNYLLSANNELVYTDTKPVGSQLVAEGPNEPVTYQRNTLNRSFLLGGGVKLKKGRDFWYVDLRYMGGMSNLTNTNKVYYAEQGSGNPPVGNPAYYMSYNVTKYHYVGDVFRLDNISLSVGFIHPIYDPRKVRKAKTKSVSRNILKRKGDGVK